MKPTAKATYPEGSITIEAFAKLGKIDKTTVQRAIDSSYLGEGAVKIGNVWRIFPEVARQNWARYFKRSAHSTPALIEFLKVPGIAATTQVQTPTPSKQFTEEQWKALTVSEAKRLTEISKARAAQMDLDERTERLVPRADVMAALVVWGQIAGTTLESNVQIVHDIRAAATDHEAMEAYKRGIKQFRTLMADLESGNISLKAGRA